jgi:hypothetical protein
MAIEYDLKAELGSMLEATTTQHSYAVPDEMDPLFKTQPLLRVLKLLAARTDGLFKIESVHLPNMMVDIALGKTYVARGYVPRELAYGDLTASARRLNRRPSWILSAHEAPFAHLLWVAAETAAPPAFSSALRYGITRMPEAPYSPHYKYTARMAALCMKQSHTISELTLLAGVSEIQVKRFLHACQAIGCLYVSQSAAVAAMPTPKPFYSRLFSGVQERWL